MRAAISACSVSGIRFARRRRPRAACAPSPRGRAGCPRSSRAASRRSAGESSRSASSASTQLLALVAARAARARSRSRARGRRPSPGGCRAARAARGRRSGAARRAPSSARCSISSSSGSSAQWMSSKTSTSGCASASSARPTRAPPRRSPAGSRSASTASSTPTASAEQVGDGLVAAARAQLLDRLLDRVVVGDPGRDLDHLGERPVGDALAVRQAAADEHGRALERRRRTRARAGSCRRRARRRREEVRAPVAHGAREGVLEQLELGLAADEAAPRAHGARPAPSRDADDPPGPERLGRAPQLERAELARPRRGRASSRRAAGPIRISPGSAACWRRAATLTASPVAKVESASSATTSPASMPIRASRPSSCTDVEDRERGANGALGVVLVRLRDRRTRP